jgi:hypothetical protein
MMDRTEKRKHKRLGSKFDISCRKVGSTAEQIYTGCTVNVSCGGLYFETTTETFKQGNLLKIELSIPPRPGLLEFGGKIAGFAKVLRTENICDSATGTDLSSGRYGIALQFCCPPKLCL